MSFKNIRNHETKQLTSGTTATVQVPTGGKIHSFMLQFNDASGDAVTEAQLKTELSNIRLSINGTDIVNADPTAIYDAYEFAGVNVSEATGVDGCLELNLGRLVFTDPVQRDVYGFGTQNVSNIQVQVTTGTLTNVASVTVITAREAENQNLGRHCRFIKYPRSFASTGKDTFDTLPRDIDSAYIAVMMRPDATGVISTGEWRLNSAILMDETPISTNALLLSSNRVKQVDGYFIYSPMDGTASAPVPMLGANDLRFVTNFTTANTSGYDAMALTIHGIPTATK